MEIKIEINSEIKEMIEYYCNIKKIDINEFILESIIEKLENWQDFENSKKFLEAKFKENQKFIKEDYKKAISFSSKNLIN